MHPRPLFYLHPYGVGITLPKETGLKTASCSTVFVTAGILFQPWILYRNKQSSTGKKHNSPVEFMLFMRLVRNPETEGDSSWADTHKSGPKLLSYVSFYGTFSHATGEKERPISQSKGPAPPLEANSCLPHMCTPALSLFTLAKFRTVCFLIRGRLWRVCWKPHTWCTQRQNKDVIGATRLMHFFVPFSAFSYKTCSSVLCAHFTI